MNMMSNPMINNVLDFMKLDPQSAGTPGGAMAGFGVKNAHDTDGPQHNNSTSIGAPSLESLINSRNLSNHLMSNSTLPFGAQVFTIPVSLATFPNSDLIPVFVNSLGQMVLANTGNLLTNSISSLASSLTSGMFGHTQPVLQNNGIVDHIMQQYQQLQAMKNSVLQQSWPSTLQQVQTEQPFMMQAFPQQVQTGSAIDHVDKTIATPIFPMPTSSSSSSLPSVKFHSPNLQSVDLQACDNRSPSVCSSHSSRSIGNKINQMIDVSNDCILGQEDHLVKEKAVELMRQSYSQQGFNNNFGETTRFMSTTGFSQASNVDKMIDSVAEGPQHTPSMTVDGVDIGEIREFARNFKIKRLSMGLTQTQVGQALTAAEGPAYSQSAICRFEKLDITPKSAQKIKPILEKWIKESEEKYRNGDNSVEEGSGSDVNKKRKRRTSFTPQALELLNVHFDKKSHPTGSEMRTLANELNYDREVIRVWFCNKRQALKNSVKRVKQSSGNENIVPGNGHGELCIRQLGSEGHDLKEKELKFEDPSVIHANQLKAEPEDLSVERKESECSIPTLGAPFTPLHCSD